MRERRATGRLLAIIWAAAAGGCQDEGDEGTTPEVDAGAAEGEGEGEGE